MQPHLLFIVAAIAYAALTPFIQAPPRTGDVIQYGELGDAPAAAADEERERKS